MIKGVAKSKSIELAFVNYYRGNKEIHLEGDTYLNEALCELDIPTKSQLRPVELKSKSFENFICQERKLFSYNYRELVKEYHDYFGNFEKLEFDLVYIKDGQVKAIVELNGAYHYDPNVFGWARFYDACVKDYVKRKITKIMGIPFMELKVNGDYLTANEAARVMRFFKNCE